jgi:hypothetical protein
MQIMAVSLAMDVLIIGESSPNSLSIYHVLISIVGMMSLRNDFVYMAFVSTAPRRSSHSLC